MDANMKIGVLLMTYGSPETLADVRPYLTNVRGGRQPEAGLVDEFVRRYELIGGSPLTAITRAQAAALQHELTRRHPAGPAFVSAVGMRFAPPAVRDGVAALAAQGAERLVAVIMSPQYSALIMRGYLTAVTEAAAALTPPLPVTVPGSWHRQPRFLDALALRVREALEALPAAERGDVQVLLSAHSMPQAVVEREPDYIAQLQDTARLVAARAGLADGQWGFCYQSAGHTPEAWLTPDFADVMPQLAARGTRRVLIAPVQFLADHLEILYDIEVAARAQAEAQGLAFARTASLNTAPLFIAALADVVEDQLAHAEDGATPVVTPA